MNDQKTDCYIGRKHCGCAVAVVFDNPLYREDVASDVAKFIRKGYKVYRAVWKDVINEVGKCECEVDESEMKCRCGSSTGWTEIKCCNICGLPHKDETLPWNLNTEKP